MQIWQAERAGSQSEADFNRGRSKFRGTKFGAKKLFFFFCFSFMESGAPSWTSWSRSDTASEGHNKAVNLNETHNSPDTGF